jgi:hypothetical protein
MFDPAMSLFSKSFAGIAARRGPEEVFSTGL